MRLIHPFIVARCCAVALLAVVTPGFAADLPGSPSPAAGSLLRLPREPRPEDFRKLTVLQHPLVPVGGTATAQENRALADALETYARRTSQDDFASLTGFLANHPRSVWRASLLTGLGLDYYKAAYYSRALEAWEEAWELGKMATDPEGMFLADRAACELAGLYSRLGRMDELETLLGSIRGRLLVGGAVERINLASEALYLMQHQPEISFRCGPLALLSIQRSIYPCEAIDATPIATSASTRRGFSLTQVSELARVIGLKYQMAYRETDDAEMVIPSVVHWKAGHYAALVRKAGDLFLAEDPTFGNSVWATRDALKDEASGYFLVPAGPLPRGWRSVAAAEGDTVWGKGVTSGTDPDNYTPDDQQVGDCVGVDAFGMAVAGVHLGVVSVQVRDTPIRYLPPVGPAISFTVRYNQRDYRQPPGEISRMFGPRWTHDWDGYIVDNPLNLLSDVKYFVGGGGARTFTGYDTNTLTYLPQQLEQTRLRRTGPNSYDMLFPDGSRKIFGSRAGTRVLLTQVLDPAGNGVTLTWNGERLIALTDAIGQVTTLSYEHASAPELITKVTDPFGRTAKFDYQTFQIALDTDNNPATPVKIVPVQTLVKITDMIGLVSQLNYQVVQGPRDTFDLALVSMTTPYGTTSFSTGQGGGGNATTRFVETTYPDNSRDRVEYYQGTNGIAFSDPAALVPKGMTVFNQYLGARNTFYWDRNAYAQGAGDYSKAKIYHWLHTPNISVTAGILESIKEPLERRVWFSYPGQVSPYLATGSSDRPRNVGRVLDDGTTQLYTYSYNSFGHVTNAIDPAGREFTYVYATNEIDLLEVRQTRGTNDQLLFSATYNDQHQPITGADASGGTTVNTYNSRGQLLTTINPKGEKTTYTYNPAGYLLSIDGPLPGSTDTMTFTYDNVGRLRTRTDETGYTLTFDYDDMDRLTLVTYPDTTYESYVYDRLDLVAVRDSAGRVTTREYDSLRQLVKQTDPLGRVTRLDWCACGNLGSLTDPMGRMTQWRSDVQGRPVSKRYPDGSKISYVYENATSRLRQMIDEKGQVSQYRYNPDNTISSVAYANAAVPTPGVVYTYDPDYPRPVSVTDGTGTTTYGYFPVNSPAIPGAGQLATIDGPLPDDVIAFTYDELGRRRAAAVNGVAVGLTYDPLARVSSETNALGMFTYSYDGASRRLASLAYPNSQTAQWAYFNNLQDRELQRITYQRGATLLSEFTYSRDVPAGRILSWSQQAGASTPNVSTFGYDAVNQLLTANVTSGGAPQSSFGYTYDPAGNRLSEQSGGVNRLSTYNPLNQISTSTGPDAAVTNEWDAQDRLVAASSGDRRTEFTYDAFNRVATIRSITNGVEASFRRFLWVGAFIWEERDAAGTVTKRFFDNGMKVETGPAAGVYYYTRDHLGSVREVVDAAGTVRARYAYDPYGRRTRVAGDLEADFGFAGMFWSAEANLNLTQFRAYDPALGRWLSRDPLSNAEMIEGPNLYTYAKNDPVRWIDPTGLAAGEIVEVISALEWGAQINARGLSWLQRGGGEIVEVVNGIIPRNTREFWWSMDRVARVKSTKEWVGLMDPSGLRFKKKLPMPEPVGGFSRFASGLGVVAEAGLTILTMTDCNTVEGIFALVRQGNGGMANKYADRLYKELEREGL